jgi:hypothetical protein
MPIPKRKKGETTVKYKNRLIGFLIREGKSPKQAAGIAYDKTKTSRKNKKAKKK